MHEALVWWNNLDEKQQNALKIDAYIRCELSHTTMKGTMHIILESFQAGDKTTYQIFKEKRVKHPRATYPPVYAMVKKLVKWGLIEETEKKKASPRKEIWYKITRAGRVMLNYDIHLS